jgi:hypothetical protein
VLHMVPVVVSPGQHLESSRKADRLVLNVIVECACVCAARGPCCGVSWTAPERSRKAHRIGLNAQLT